MADPTTTDQDEQQRRLEENWKTGRFTNFQLPLPEYTQEGHLDCVYTIQFVAKWLVSGSRDGTLRIWDLETKRLRGEPLRGHEASVLCLQFDPTEKEDVIISGSVDASFIVWRFSRGEKIRRIENAHSDSILSLRFDDRYLVTGSKDGLIKVWNRQSLGGTEKDSYSSVPHGPGTASASYIVDTKTIPPPMLESQAIDPKAQTFGPYSLLITLKGHNASVNAIQICGDKVVSGSGDWSIKIWNLRSGSCEMTILGHERGIACLHADGQRIVSGSADGTIRIFDSTTGAQISFLQGHSDLVRTLQSGFVPFTSPEIDGGSWNQIVSGSYDGSIIVWRKDSDENWVIFQRLKQEDASRAAAGDRSCETGNPQVGSRAADEQPRVFKLQFDSEKIICCSQERKILGWEFASHDDVISA